MASCHAENSVKLDMCVFEIGKQTDKQTYRSADSNTLHPD